MNPRRAATAPPAGGPGSGRGSTRGSGEWVGRRATAAAAVLPAVGLAFIGWALIDPRFRDMEGALRGAFVLPVSIGLGLVVLGLSVRIPEWLEAGGWCALGLVGQAAVLQLIDAGRLLHFQHYRSLPTLLAEAPVPLGLALAQAALVAWGVWPRVPSAWAWLRDHFPGGWRLAGLGAAFVVPAVALSQPALGYGGELLAAVALQAVSLGNMALVAAALPTTALEALKRQLDCLLDGDQHGGLMARARLDRFAVIAATWVVILAAGLSFFVYEHHPHVPDEALYLYQAHYLSEGKLSVPAPTPPEAFSVYMIPDRAKLWYSPFPPAWPAVLAVALRLGAPWLLNPVLAGLNVLLSYLLVQQIYNRRTARLTVLLLCASPWHVFMAMSFMSHTFTLTCVLGAALMLLGAYSGGNGWWAFGAGGAVGVVALTRPLDGAIVGGVLGVGALGASFRLRRLGAAVLPLVAFAFGAVAVGSLMLPYNAALTGSPTALPLETYYNEYFGWGSNAYGFGPERGLGWSIDAFPGHSPFEAVLNSTLNAFSVNTELFGWAMGSLLAISVLALSGAASRRDYLILTAVGWVIVAYAGYWYHGGPDFGARYWFLVLVPCVMLTARSVELVECWLSQTPMAGRLAGVRVTVTLLVLCMVALLIYFPWRAADKYYHYLNMRPDLATLAADNHFERSLVLVRGESHPDYESSWVYNPLDFEAPVPIYAWDRDPDMRLRILRSYSDRPVWLVDGPSLTGGAYRIVAGPLPASAFLDQ